MKTALVLGAGGFIGSHLVKELRINGYFVRGVDLKYPDFSPSGASEFAIQDLRLVENVNRVLDFDFDEVYQLAADMGGAGYIFTGDHDAVVMHNSGLINLNVANRMVEVGAKKIFFSSSACIYPQQNQADPSNPNCAEPSAFPANPDSEYGWEKIFSERMYMAYKRNFGLDVRIARFHNIFGPEGSWNNGKEKAPAAICRKVAQARDGGHIDIWGDGTQTRSFLYINECLIGIQKLMEHPTFTEPLNIGSEEMVSINQLAEMIIWISGKNIEIHNIPGPIGVMGRNSDNTLIQKTLGWKPSSSLIEGLEITYDWINKQVHGK